ncbi:MAG: Spy/CpxP family protein refolding chaperone [Planctomycetota bacterium]|jgi:Spy/CpxP family protein refolding chaperone
MRLIPTRRSLPWWLLIISIAFNLGFGATYGAKTYGPGAGPPRGGAGLGGGAMSMVYLDENLDLSAQQQAQFRSINEALITEIDALREELREARIALAQLLGEARLDPQALTGQLDAISATQREAQELVVDHLLQEKRLLRPDQVEAFNEVIKSRVCPGYGMGRGGQGRGMGQGRGQGLGPRGGNGRGQGRGWQGGE